MAFNRSRGFTLMELMVSMTVFLIASGVLLMGVQPALKESRVVGAYNLTLNIMRQARDTTIAKRFTYAVAFAPSVAVNGVNVSQITVTPGFGVNAVDTYNLPTDVYYMVLANFPKSQVTFPLTPDTFGTGGNAIDFDQGVVGGQQNVIYFSPDGSAQDINGNINNGVIYIARPGDYYSAKAITVWGATGRIRGWRMDQTGGTTYYWRQQ